MSRKSESQISLEKDYLMLEDKYIEKELENIKLLASLNEMRRKLEQYRENAQSVQRTQQIEIEQLKTEELVEYFRGEVLNLKGEISKRDEKLFIYVGQLEEVARKFQRSNEDVIRLNSSLKKAQEQIKSSNYNFSQAQKRLSNIEKEKAELIERCESLQKQKHSLGVQLQKQLQKRKSEDQLAKNKFQSVQQESLLQQQIEELQEIQSKFAEVHAELKMYKNSENALQQMFEAQIQDLNEKFLREREINDSFIREKSALNDKIHQLEQEVKNNQIQRESIVSKSLFANDLRLMEIEREMSQQIEENRFLNKRVANLLEQNCKILTYLNQLEDQMGQNQINTQNPNGGFEQIQTSSYSLRNLKEFQALLYCIIQDNLTQTNENQVRGSTENQRGSANEIFSIEGVEQLSLEPFQYNLLEQLNDFIIQAEKRDPVREKLKELQTMYNRLVAKYYQLQKGGIGGNVNVASSDHVNDSSNLSLSSSSLMKNSFAARAGKGSQHGEISKFSLESIDESNGAARNFIAPHSSLTENSSHKKSYHQISQSVNDSFLISKLFPKKSLEFSNLKNENQNPLLSTLLNNQKLNFEQKENLNNSFSNTQLLHHQNYLGFQIQQKQNSVSKANESFQIDSDYSELKRHRRVNSLNQTIDLQTNNLDNSYFLKHRSKK